MNLRTTVLASALAGAVLLAIPSATLSATALVPTTSPAPSAAAVAADRGALRTRLTFTVDDCEGCEIQIAQAPQTLHSDADVWQSKVRAVTNGKVTFRVAPRRTRGMSATVTAPWEGATGYVTTVAWRYNGLRVGDAVTLEEAVTKTRASACWKGVRRRHVTIPLVVEEVEVDGAGGRVPGSIAFVATTMSWLRPMRAVAGGVLGSQDVNLCG